MNTEKRNYAAGQGFLGTVATCFAARPAAEHIIKASCSNSRRKTAVHGMAPDSHVEGTAVTCLHLFQKESYLRFSQVGPCSCCRAVRHSLPSSLLAVPFRRGAHTCSKTSTHAANQCNQHPSNQNSLWCDPSRLAKSHNVQKHDISLWRFPQTISLLAFFNTNVFLVRLIIPTPNSWPLHSEARGSSLPYSVACWSIWHAGLLGYMQG